MLCAETFLDKLYLQYLHPLWDILGCAIDTSHENYILLGELA